MTGSDQITAYPTRSGRLPYFEMGKIRQRLVRRAYAAIEHEQNRSDKLSDLGERQARRSQKQKPAWARRLCQQAINDYDAFDAAVRQARAAMQWVDLDSSQRRNAQQVADALYQATEAMRAIDYPGCSKVADYLTHRAPGLGAYAEELHNQPIALAAGHGEQAVSLAAVIIQLIDELNKHRPRWQRQAYAKQLIGAYHLLNAYLGEQTDPLLEQVQQLWRQRHRASSAIGMASMPVSDPISMYKKAPRRAFWNSTALITIYVPGVGDGIGAPVHISA